MVLPSKACALALVARLSHTNRGSRYCRSCMSTFCRFVMQTDARSPVQCWGTPEALRTAPATAVAKAMLQQPGGERPGREAGISWGWSPVPVGGQAGAHGGTFPTEWWESVSGQGKGGKAGGAKFSGGGQSGGILGPGGGIRTAAKAAAKSYPPPGPQSLTRVSSVQGHQNSLKSSK